MSIEMNYSDPKYAEAAARILERHNRGEPEANINRGPICGHYLASFPLVGQGICDVTPAQQNRQTQGTFGL